MFNRAQNFFVDPDLFITETYIVVPKIELFFKSCPPPDGSCASGIHKPGITVYIVSCTDPDGQTPCIQDVQSLQCWTTRVEWDDIRPSNDGSKATICLFREQVRLSVGHWYSVLFDFDGNEAFEFWENKVGDPICQPLPFSSNGMIGNTVSTIISGGPGCKYVGKYFHYAGGWTPTQLDSGASTTLACFPAPQTCPPVPMPQDQCFWNCIPSTCIKFCVYFCRYAVGGNNIIANTSANGSVGSTSNNIDFFDGCTVNGHFQHFDLPCERMEYLSYDHDRSKPFVFQIGDRCWHEQPFWRGPDCNVIDFGNPFRCIVTSNTTNCFAANTKCDFTQLFDGGAEDEFLVCHSNDHDGPGHDRVECRKVLTHNSSLCVIDHPFTFSNSNCYFYKAPVCEIQHSDFDYFDDYKYDDGRRRGLLYCRNSNANASHRFLEHCIRDRDCVISAGGTGFSNSDWCEITGFEEIVCVVHGHFKAVCNLMTNSTGGVVNIFFSNTGCGFSNTANIVFTFFKAGGGLSLGTSCTIVPVIDACYRTERRHPELLEPCEMHFGRLRCLPYDRFVPSLECSIPDTSSYRLTCAPRYYRIEDDACDAGWRFHRYDDDSVPEFECHDKEECLPPVRFRPIMPCRSKEFMILTGTCGPAIQSVNNCPRYYSSSTNCHNLHVNCTTSSDNCAPVVHPNTTVTTFYRYLMNDDYTLENTNYGNCLSKQIESKVTFANNQFAEDIKVWLTAYRPPGSDFKVFVKMFNTADSDSFDDKDWTLLQDMSTNIGLSSSPTDDTTTVELGYELAFSPNTSFTLAGSANATSGQQNLVGFGTSWQTNATSNVVAGSLVKIYQPLFPNVFRIAVVNNVVNDTLITLNDPVVNNTLLGTPLNVDVIGFPHQAFLNMMNDNIVRYYNSTMVPFDTFNTMQIKICFLDVSGNTVANTQEYIPGVPYIDDIRAVGVSA